MVVYAAQAVKVKDKKMELHASKFRLLNVVLLDNFFNDVVKMNDKKHKDELDAGKAGNTQRLWSSISNEYDDSANNEVLSNYETTWCSIDYTSCRANSNITKVVYAVL
jgi:hypothetical protein